MHGKLAENVFFKFISIITLPSSPVTLIWLDRMRRVALRAIAIPAAHWIPFAILYQASASAETIFTRRNARMCGLATISRTSISLFSKLNTLSLDHS